MSKQCAAPALPSVPLANLSIVHGWFDEAALGLPYPGDDDCYALARELQVAVKRSNNAIWISRSERTEKDIPNGVILDVSPADLIADRWSEERAAERSLSFYLERLLELRPNFSPKEMERLELLQSYLPTVFRKPNIEVWRKVAFPHAPPVARGRRIMPWHDVGHVISRTIQTLLRAVGYSGRHIKKTDQEAPTAIIGAAAISWAFNIEIQPEGFASAMRRRDRRKEVQNRLISDFESLRRRK